MREESWSFQRLSHGWMRSKQFLRRSCSISKGSTGFRASKVESASSSFPRYYPLV